LFWRKSNLTLPDLFKTARAASILRPLFPGRQEYLPRRADSGRKRPILVRIKKRTMSKHGALMVKPDELQSIYG